MHYRGPVGNAQDNAKRYSRPAKTGKDAWKSFAASLVNSSHPCWFISLWRDKKKMGWMPSVNFNFKVIFKVTKVITDRFYGALSIFSVQAISLQRGRLTQNFR